MMSYSFDYALSAISALSVAAVLIAILADFACYADRSGVKKQRNSFVATGSMTLFYVAYCAVIWRKLGRVDVANELTHRILATIGAASIVAGACLNILGRLKLSRFWANQITIYADHQLLTDGIFGVVRHPLYASLILMLLSGSLMYANLVAAVATLAIFVPFMYIRARQEELLLAQEFSEYEAYRQRTGMFFPKLRK